MGNLGRIAAAFLSILVCAACSSVNVGNLPSDTSSKITALVTSAQDAQRASDAIGWGSTVSLAQLGAKPIDLAAFTAAVCDPPFFHSAVAARVFETYNGQVTNLAKAPDASLGAYIRSIKQLDQAISEIKQAPAPKDYATLQSDLTKKCTPLVTRDLALTGQLQPMAIPLIAAADALIALFKIPTVVAQIAEAQTRAEAVKIYVVAHDPELTKALDVLGSGGLDAVIQSTRTYYARRAFAHYADLASYRASSATRPAMTPLDVADTYSQYVVRYLRLQAVSGTALIEDDKDGLRAAYSTFVNAAKSPNADPLAALDGFLLALKNISDLGGAIADYKKALSDVSGGS